MVTEQRVLATSRYPLAMTNIVSEAYQHLYRTEHFYDSPYDATYIAQAALCHWNSYVAHSNDANHQAFLAYARWLVQHEVRIGNDAGGWPIVAKHPDSHIHAPWLSALTQGCALSVMVRAFLLTSETCFLDVARRVVQTFLRDILDGGVHTPTGKDGIFFEEIAVYPASHSLKGFLFGITGLYDYVNLCKDQFITSERHQLSADSDAMNRSLRGLPEDETQTNDVLVSLIQKSLATFHDFLHEYDTGFWTYSDLRYRHLSSRSELALQATLLDSLAGYSQCEQCSMIATRWHGYSQSAYAQLRYAIASRCKQVGDVLLHRMRNMLIPRYRLPVTDTSLERDALRVCIPITAFPVTGGMRSVLFRIIQVTKHNWQSEYLTHHIGRNTSDFLIHRFGSSRMSPWQFPAVWLYTCAGFCKLLSLLRDGVRYDVILLQDGIYTAAFGGMVAKLAGIRSVCIDHGNLSILRSQAYRAERLKTLETEYRHLPRRLIARIQYACYWPSLSLLAKLSTYFVDHYYIPGATGDGVEEVCNSLGVPSSRITRFANMIETEKHIIPDTLQRATRREQLSIASDAIVVAIVCRLAPEKGLEITVEAISKAIAALSPEVAKRLHIIIAGDGPLRASLEEDIRLRGLSKRCLFLGEASQKEVIETLGISDIFLFTSWRAAGYPLTVLEAMASACAVIAATDSLATQEMLADGRGIVLTVGDVTATTQAIIQLANDPQVCHQIGITARNYVAEQHSPEMFRRSLTRVTYWSGLESILRV